MKVRYFGFKFPSPSDWIKPLSLNFDRQKSLHMFGRLEELCIRQHSTASPFNICGTFYREIWKPNTEAKKVPHAQVKCSFTTSSLFKTDKSQSNIMCYPFIGETWRMIEEPMCWWKLCERLKCLFLTSADQVWLNGSTLNISAGVTQSSRTNTTECLENSVLELQ